MTERTEDVTAEAPGQDGGESTFSQQADATISDAEQTVVDASGAELNDLKSQLLRVHADFDNFRKRTRQEREDLQKFATKAMAFDLLSVVDNFDRAMVAIPTEKAFDSVRTGVEMVQRQLLAVLDKHGVAPMDVEGKPFNPQFHEAVMQEPAEGREPGTVVQELQRGYTIHDKVLRPAMVKVTV